jgi:16S rRNA (uracil1498-N3)-methyltransferase
MKIHRFIGPWDFSKSDIEITNPENIKQIRSVLRLEIGEQLILSDGAGHEALASISHIDSKKVICKILKIEKVVENSRKVNLYLAILKKENFELAVQKMVECGVSKIIPVITERTVKTGLNFERLEKIVLEASEQSGRSIVPELSPILSFKDALEDGKNSKEKIVFHFVENKYTPDKKADSVSIFIGPEGGFTDKEVEEAKESDYKVASLGENTLRGETAAIVATYRAVNSI